MQPTWSNVMVLPKGEHSQRLCCKRPMDAQMGSHHAVPVLCGTAGANRQIPDVEQRLYTRASVRVKPFQQFLRLLAQDRSALLRPGAPAHSLGSHRSQDLFLDGIHALRKQHLVRPRQADWRMDARDFALQSGKSVLLKRCQHKHNGFPFALPMRMLHHPLLKARNIAEHRRVALSHPMPIHASLHVSGQMHEMPDLALMESQRPRVLERSDPGLSLWAATNLAHMQVFGENCAEVVNK
jgi:hypothetical protein